MASSFNATAFRSLFICTITHHTDFVSLSCHRILLHTHCTLTSSACKRWSLDLFCICVTWFLSIVCRMWYIIWHDTPFQKGSYEFSVAESDWLILEARYLCRCGGRALVKKSEILSSVPTRRMTMSLSSTRSRM